MDSIKREEGGAKWKIRRINIQGFGTRYFNLNFFLSTLLPETLRTVNFLFFKKIIKNVFSKGVLKKVLENNKIIS